jgi:YVTN family beta-propeller protein
MLGAPDLPFRRSLVRTLCYPTATGGILALVVTLAVAAALPLAAPVEHTPVLTDEPVAVAVDSARQRFYLSMFASQEILAVDESSRRPLAVISVAGLPSCLAVNPATGHVYACVPNGVAVLAGATDTVLGTVVLGRKPLAIAVDPVTNRVYVTAEAVWGIRSHDSLTVLDGFADTVVREIPVGLDPLGVAVNPRTNRIYVANAASGTVTVLDGTVDAVRATVPVGRSPFQLDVNPATNRVYVARREVPSLTVLDGGRDAVVAAVPMSEVPVLVAVNTRTNRVYVAGTAGDVSVLDGATNRVIATLAVRYEPTGLAVDPSRNRVYATTALWDAVWLIQDGRFGLPAARLVAASSQVVGGPDASGIPATG